MFIWQSKFIKKKFILFRTIPDPDLLWRVRNQAFLSHIVIANMVTEILQASIHFPIVIILKWDTLRILDAHFCLRGK